MLKNIRAFVSWGRALPFSLIRLLRPRIALLYSQSQIVDSEWRSFMEETKDHSKDEIRADSEALWPVVRDHLRLPPDESTPAIVDDLDKHVSAYLRKTSGVGLVGEDVVKMRALLRLLDDSEVPLEPVDGAGHTVALP